VVAGFSLQAKAWGLVAVSGLRDVTFNEEAFARLVLPDSRKQLIKALVLSHAQSSSTASSSPVLVSPAGAGGRATTDVIEGKGEGTIFLLHGPPGVGKTLTAEAVAELLHRPLYTVSIGELGTTPEILEERLMDVFDLCVPWGALVLIDEAEMLLECRTKSDNIVRNAMVCVMLRLVEYYRGILFLTTNRVECLDPAFQSRVQCALRYQPLNAAGRRAIWEDLLARRGAGEVDTEVDLDSLAAHELNGRQIKNVLQLALALARHENVPLGKRHLAATLEVTVNFIGSVS
jgi:SpoVK/Ycf46/Vps4 family AAA+-type ATPase